MGKYTTMIAVRFTPSEVAAIRALAEAARSNTSAVLRGLVREKAHTRGLWPATSENEPHTREIKR